MKFLDLYCQDPVIKYVKLPAGMVLEKIDDDYDFLIINYRGTQADNNMDGFIFNPETTTLNDIINYIVK
jgi:hypothetical protein